MDCIKIIVILFILSYVSDESFGSLFLLHDLLDCPESDKNPIHYNGTIKNLTANRFEINGVTRIDEVLAGPLEAQVSARGCDLKMNQCDNHYTFVIPDICKVFDMKNQLWSDIAAHTHPRLKCPLKPPVLEVKNATTDLSVLSHLPVEGFIWTLTFKIFQRIPNVRHKKRLLFCLIVEGSVVKNKQKPKK